MNESLNEFILTFFRSLIKEPFRLLSLGYSNDTCKDATMVKFKVSFIKVTEFIPPKRNEKTVDLIINGERLNFITDNLDPAETLDIINFNIDFIREFIEKEINWMQREKVPRPGDIKGRQALQSFLDDKIKALYELAGVTVDAIDIFVFADFITMVTTVLENFFNKDFENGH